MKRLFYSVFLIIVFIAFAAMAQAQTWHTVNQATVAWDAVTANEQGVTIPADQISYAVYLCNAIADPSCASPQEIAKTSALTQLITLDTEGRFWFGVRAIRTVDGEVVGQSSISWSNDANVSSNAGLQYFLPPAAVGGLTVQ